MIIKHLLDKKTTRFFLLIVLIVVTILSLMPLNQLEIEVPLGTDKLVHLIMYFTISTLMLWSYPDKSTFMLVMFVILYSIIIEVLQEYMPLKRSGDIYDVIANSIGAFLGIISQSVLKKIEKSFK